MHEIIISNKDDVLTTVLTEGGTVLEKYEEKNKQNRIEGNIYIGKVQNVLPGMQAAFVDIGESKNTFIHLKDVLPKIDETKNLKNNNIKNVNIKNIIKPGTKLLVQVKRDAFNQKGARISTHISIPSRYVVIMPNTDFVTVSQKIDDEKEKQRLIKITKEVLPNGYGAIIRTSAENKTMDEIKKEIDISINKWNIIKNEFEKDKESSKGKILYRSPDIVERTLLDLIDQDIKNIYVDDKNVLDKVKHFLEKIGNNETKIIYKEENLFSMYDINKQIEKIKNRKVWLKCGGFITIDKTEALTAIDVNSGKYVGTKDLEHTVFKVNEEASVEIAKQLKLRDIGGIIIIDYIDMQEEENKEKIIKILEENLKKDRSKTQVIGFSKLNLLEMTRKHMYSNE